jgi:hypothetical protein
MSSASNAGRFAGKSYSVVTHKRNPRYLIKLVVNDWLAGLAKAVLDSTPVEYSPWALLLETSELNTLQALQAVTCISASTTVVPNPDEKQLELMRSSAPGITALPMTSHTLLRALSDRESPEYLSLIRKEGSSWPGQFSVVWLDYCGTFSSTAGRQRQSDIMRLMQNGLLASPSLLAVTMSQRGAPVLYEHEVLDLLVLFLRNVGRIAGLRVQVAGGVTYDITSRQYTMAFVISKLTEESVTFPPITGYEAFTDGTIPARYPVTRFANWERLALWVALRGDEAGKAGGVGGTYKEGGKKEKRVKKKQTPLFEATLKVAEAFEEVLVEAQGQWLKKAQGESDKRDEDGIQPGRELGSGGSSYTHIRMLIQDTKLLPVTNAVNRAAGAAGKGGRATTAVGGEAGRIESSMSESTASGGIAPNTPSNPKTPCNPKTILTMVADPLDCRIASELNSNGALAVAGEQPSAVDPSAVDPPDTSAVADTAPPPSAEASAAASPVHIECIRLTEALAKIEGAKAASVAEGNESGVWLESERLDAVWLGYEHQKAFSMQQLQRCGEWADVNELFRKRVLREDGGVLGILVGHSSNGECWEGAAVEWLVNGLQRAAARWGLSTGLELRRIASYNVSFPRLTVIFQVMRAPTSPTVPLVCNPRGAQSAGVVDAEQGAADASAPPPPPCQWQESHTSSARFAERALQLKQPSRDSTKYKRATKYICGLMRFHRCRAVLLHEHGFHHIHPALLTLQQTQQQQQQGALRVCCCVFRNYGKTAIDRNTSGEDGDTSESREGGDAVGAGSHLVCGPLQSRELERKGAEFLCAENFCCVGEAGGAASANGTLEHLQQFDSMVLLVEGGRSSWRGLWLTPLQRWFEVHARMQQDADNEQAAPDVAQLPDVLVLVLLFESQKPVPANEVVQEVVQMADAIGWDSVTERPAGPPPAKDGKTTKVNGNGEINGLWSTGRRWVFVSCIFRFRGSRCGASLAERQAKWADVRPDVN